MTPHTRALQAERDRKLDAALAIVLPSIFDARPDLLPRTPTTTTTNSAGWLVYTLAPNGDGLPFETSGQYRYGDDEFVRRKCDGKMIQLFVPLCEHCDTAMDGKACCHHCTHPHERAAYEARAGFVDGLRKAA